MTYRKIYPNIFLLTNCPNIFLFSKLSRILAWQCNQNNTGFPVDECDSDKTNIDQKVIDGNRVFKSLRCNNLNKLSFAHLNISSIRNKFELLSEQVRSKVDVLMVPETKVDDGFLIGNFIIQGFSPPYRLDHNSNGGRIILFIREDIPSNLLATNKESIGSLYGELNLRNE